MKRTKQQWLFVGLVAVLILTIGLIHLLLAREEFEETPYMGVLFVANFLAAGVAAVAISRGRSWGWLLGALVAAGSIAGYAVSRTSGMPGHDIEAWATPEGVLALALEGLFVLVTFAVWPRLAREARLLSGRLRTPVALAPYAMVTAICALSLVAGVWFSRTQLVTQEALEEELGLQVTQIVTTMLGGVINVRVIVSDADKAAEVFNEHENMPYLRVADSGALLLPPDHGAHIMTLREGKMYHMFFPNPDLEVAPGTEVSIVFGRKELPPMTVN